MPDLKLKIPKIMYRASCEPIDKIETIQVQGLNAFNMPVWEAPAICGGTITTAEPFESTTSFIATNEKEAKQWLINKAEERLIKARQRLSVTLKTFSV